MMIMPNGTQVEKLMHSIAQIGTAMYDAGVHYSG
jgi:hypothetical protein